MIVNCSSSEQIERTIFRFEDIERERDEHVQRKHGIFVALKHRLALRLDGSNSLPTYRLQIAC